MHLYLASGLYNILFIKSYVIVKADNKKHSIIYNNININFISCVACGLLADCWHHLGGNKTIC